MLMCLSIYIVTQPYCKKKKYMQLASVTGK